MSSVRQRSSRKSANGKSNGKSNGKDHEDSVYTSDTTEKNEKSKHSLIPSSSSSIFHSHSHSHGNGHDEDDEDEHAGEALMLLEALRGRGDPGSRVTLIGLFSNVGLTILKGGAGWYLNSAALVADAGHSLSDLIADLVTLFTLIFSMRPPSPRYPLGYGKFESLGTITVSIFLLLGGLGIGLHSWGLLSQTLQTTLSNNKELPSWLANLLHSLISVSSIDPHEHGHSHSPGMGEGESLSPSAILFPLFGILVKEYLYRATKKVAEEQNSSVLMANAMHHRSDAYSSIVTIVAILGSLIWESVPVDPLGGMIVGLLILLSSFNIFKGAIIELTDASVSPSTLSSYEKTITSLSKSSKKERQILSVDHIRAIRSGSSVFVDVHVTLSRHIDVIGVVDTIKEISEHLKQERKEVKEVRVAFDVEGI